MAEPNDDADRQSSADEGAESSPPEPTSAPSEAEAKPAKVTKAADPQAIKDRNRRIREEAAAKGVDLIRVDCYAGDDRKLVAAYERLGFTPAFTFQVKEWPGQVLTMRLSEAV